MLCQHLLPKGPGKFRRPADAGAVYTRVPKREHRIWLAPMMRVAAPLAAALLASAALAACGGSGAEPGGPNEGAPATPVLDFPPNAGPPRVYPAAAKGDYKKAGGA